MLEHSWVVQKGLAWSMYAHFLQKLPTPSTSWRFSENEPLDPRWCKHTLCVYSQHNNIPVNCQSELCHSAWMHLLYGVWLCCLLLLFIYIKHLHKNLTQLLGTMILPSTLYSCHSSLLSVMFQAVWVIFIPNDVNSVCILKLQLDTGEEYTLWVSLKCFRWAQLQHFHIQFGGSLDFDQR